MSSLLNYVETHRKETLREFSQNMMFCLIATTPSKIHQHARDWSWNVSELEGVSRDDAVVIRKPGHNPQLWVRHGVRRYRRLFLKFLQQHVEPGISQIALEWQVDHMQASHRFASDHPTYFIRLSLVERAVNASYGAGFEKAFYGRERKTDPNGGFHMDWITFLKSQAFRLPGKATSEVKWAEWAWQVASELVERGYPDRVEAFHGITVVLNMGYTERYESLPIPPEHDSLAKTSPFWTSFYGHEEPKPSLIEGRLDIGALLNGGGLKPLTDIGPSSSPAVEAAYRRGFHQAVAELMRLIEAGHIPTHKELEHWVETDGMKWRKDLPLDRQVIPPAIRSAN